MVIANEVWENKMSCFLKYVLHNKDQQLTKTIAQHCRFISFFPLCVRDYTEVEVPFLAEFYSSVSAKHLLICVLLPDLSNS